MPTITLGWPDPVLFPNRKNGRHFRVSQAAKEKARTEGFIAARGLVAPESGDIPLHVNFHFPNKRSRDLDGLLGAIKANLDGISKALGIDDKRFNPITIERHFSGLGCVEVEF